MSHRQSLDVTIDVNPDEAGIFDLVYKHRNDGAQTLGQPDHMDWGQWYKLAVEVDMIVAGAVPAGVKPWRNYMLDEFLRRTVKFQVGDPRCDGPGDYYWFAFLNVKE